MQFRFQFKLLQSLSGKGPAHSTCTRELPWYYALSSSWKQ